MPRVPTKKRKRARGPNYPWERWLTRARLTIVRGSDYFCSQSSIVQQIRNAARREGVRVHIEDLNDRVTILVAREGAA